MLFNNYARSIILILYWIQTFKSQGLKFYFAFCHTLNTVYQAYYKIFIMKAVAGKCNNANLMITCRALTFLVAFYLYSADILKLSIHTYILFSTSEEYTKWWIHTVTWISEYKNSHTIWVCVCFNSITCSKIVKRVLTEHTNLLYCWQRARRALMLFNDVPMRTRRVLSLYKVYGNNTLLVLNWTSLNSLNAVTIIVTIITAVTIIVTADNGLPAVFHCNIFLLLCTVEPHYNEVLGTMKITLLFQVSHYIRVKTKYKELGPAKLPCYKRVLLYPTSL